jgi:hypothetical protein
VALCAFSAELDDREVVRRLAESSSVFGTTGAVLNGKVLSTPWVDDHATMIFLTTYP